MCQNQKRKERGMILMSIKKNMRRKENKLFRNHGEKAGHVYNIEITCCSVITVEHGGVGNFVTGCELFEMDSITKQSQSKYHLKCEFITVARSKSVESSSAAGIIRSLYDTNENLFLI